MLRMFNFRRPRKSTRKIRRISSLKCSFELLEPRVVLDASTLHVLYDAGTGDADSAPAALGGQQGVDTLQLTSRWSSTATDGGGLGQGDPTVLTWSIVPDDITSISGYAGEPASASNLVSFLDSTRGAGPGGSDLTQRPWFSVFSESFARWSELTGIEYVYSAADDGAALGTLSGALGTRGDIRIGGHYIDGQSGSNILAYNFYPNNGDMVLDTSNVNSYSDTSNDSRAFRNTVTHEAGHGIGLATRGVQRRKLLDGALHRHVV